MFIIYAISDNFVICFFCLWSQRFLQVIFWCGEQILLIFKHIYSFYGHGVGLIFGVPTPPVFYERPKGFFNICSFFIRPQFFAVVIWYGTVVGIGVPVCRQVGFCTITFDLVYQSFWYFRTLITGTR